MDREMVLTFKATEELDNLIETTAARQECSKSAIIRQALNEYFARRPMPEPKPTPPARHPDDIAHDWDVTERGRIEAQRS